MAKDKGKEFVGPKGICMCGHTGGGENSQHGRFGPGMGSCHAKGCRCLQFTPVRWTKKYQNYLATKK